MTTKTTRRDGRSNLYVIPSGKGWAVKRGAHDATSIYATQSSAIEAAAKAIRATGGLIEIRGRNGQVRTAVSVGMAGASKIAAVEDIDLAKALGGFFPENDTLSPRERLAMLANELRGRRS